MIHDRPRAHKPELFVLCDISGSVADFSLFTLTLMSALSAEIARTRSFVFVDDVDEVTELLGGHQPRDRTVAAAAQHERDRRRRPQRLRRVLERFWREIGDRELHRTSTVIVTGDARTNHRGNGEEWLGRIAERVASRLLAQPRAACRLGHLRLRDRRVRRHCSSTFEVRNLRQLVAAVEHLF